MYLKLIFMLKFLHVSYCTNLLGTFKTIKKSTRGEIFFEFNYCRPICLIGIYEYTNFWFDQNMKFIFRDLSFLT